MFDEMTVNFTTHALLGESGREVSEDCLPRHLRKVVQRLSPLTRLLPSELEL